MRLSAILCLASCLLTALMGGLASGQHKDERIFATPADAQKSSPEKLAYVVATYGGTDVKKPDYLTTIDLDPVSKTYSQVIHRDSMEDTSPEMRSILSSMTTRRCCASWQQGFASKATRCGRIDLPG